MIVSQPAMAEISSEVVRVSNAAQLKYAIDHADGPTTIVMTGGNYGELLIKDVKNLYNLTIKSESKEDPAIFNRITVVNSNNIAFQEIEVEQIPTLLTTPSSIAVGFHNSSNIEIRDSLLHGGVALSGSKSDVAAGSQSADGNIIGYPTGRALAAIDSNNVRIIGNEIREFAGGIALSSVKDTVVENNEVHHLRRSPLIASGTDNVDITGNHFHSSKPWSLGGAGDHADFIHVWSTDLRENNDLTIRSNTMEKGDGAPLLGIFLEDNGKADLVGYRNLIIENNIIKNGMTTGILVANAKGFSIQNNSLLMDGGESRDWPTIRLSGNTQDGVVRNNILGVPMVNNALVENRSSIKIESNYVVQADNPDGENYIGRLFRDIFDKTATVQDWMALPDSAIERLQVGSSLTRFDPAAFVGYVKNENVGSSFVIKEAFDASNIYDAFGKVNTDGARVKWNFGDGKTGSGLLTEHIYEKPGSYTATATITLANGKLVVIDKTLIVETLNYLDANFDLNANDLSGLITAVNIGAGTLEAANGGKAIRLNNGTVKYDATSEFINNSEFSLVVDFKKDVGEELQGGKLVYFAGSFVVTLGANGITVDIATTLGGKSLQASRLGIDDADWHRLGVTFSGETGFAKLYLDGKEVASIGGLAGAVQKGYVGADLVLGGPFGGSFGGLIDNVHFVGEALTPAAMAVMDKAEAPVAPLPGTLAGVVEQDIVSNFVLNRSEGPKSAGFLRGDAFDDPWRIQRDDKPEPGFHLL